MHRIARTEKSFDLLRRIPPSQNYNFYLCSTCKHQAYSFSSSVRRPADANLPLLGKLRKKIWGTNEPPGQADPYGKDSHFDRVKQAASEEKLQAKKKSKTIAPPYSGDYEPANTWDGLEQVGEDEGIRESDWLPGNSYRNSFVPKEVFEDQDEIKAALHRALVEVFSWQQAGNQLSMISQVRPGRDLTRKVQILNSETGVTLQYSDEAAGQDIVRSLTEFEPSDENIAAEASVKDALQLVSVANGDGELVEPVSSMESEDIAEITPQLDSAGSEKAINSSKASASPAIYRELVASWDPSWTQTPITDPEIKFAVIKRMMQLSGIRIPDAVITSSRTSGALLTQIIKVPKQIKLTEALSQKQKLVNLHNVSIFKSRVTSRDKEKALGRWKVIEEELQARGLMQNNRN